MRSLDDIERMIGFFEARQGQLYGFRWKDWSDFKSCEPSKDPSFADQVIGTGDGQTRVFSLVKTYRSGAQSYARPILKPVAGTTIVGIDGSALVETVDYTVDTGTGQITFTDAPAIDAPVSAGFEFDVPVRFDTERIQTSVASFQAGEIPSVPIVEIRI